MGSPIIYGVLTNRSGATSSTWLLGMAATMSDAGKRVAVLDMDMEGGTLLGSLGLVEPEGGKSLNNLMGGGEIGANALMSQMLTVSGHKNLRLLPGLRNARFGPELRRPLLHMEGALKDLPDDYVFLDLGHPVSHANLSSPQATLDVINAVCDQVFIVIKDDPGFMVQAIDVFQHLHFTAAHAVICEQRKGRALNEMRQHFTRYTRLPLLAGWSWDDKKAHQLADQGKTWPMGDLPRRCGLMVE